MGVWLCVVGIGIDVYCIYGIGVCGVGVFG